MVQVKAHQMSNAQHIMRKKIMLILETNMISFNKEYVSIKSNEKNETLHDFSQVTKIS